MLKKQLIMEKALELFAKQGFEATSVQQITEHCGISKGAFYLSFKSKDELILALIDQFMIEFITDIDYLVSNSVDTEKLLYDFYFTMYKMFEKHNDFAKILMHEQTQSFNEELLLKMKNYDRIMDKTILSMIELLYGDRVTEIKYDLIYCIKSFMKSYSELFLFYNVPLDIDALSKSLVEKTNLIAQHASIPFITEDLLYKIEVPFDENVTNEQLLDIIKQKIEEMDESIEKESLLLLKQDLLEPVYKPAIVKGLLENIRNNPHCKWISYLLRKHYQF
ncbi:TetR/AcrR family transcriptional regulator [Fredinandcohnia sp. 179-A 10B2 NHS]|uniref:TetR/AcrR family transcriptional regulator n=1 Tax=Fredinandcohnia sp. 179-A 10B2 NHS TaxID=3235176 RepID=UPI00399F45FD